MQICKRCKHHEITYCSMGRFTGKNIDQKKPLGKCLSFKRIQIKQVE